LPKTCFTLGQNPDPISGLFFIIEMTFFWISGFPMFEQRRGVSSNDPGAEKASMLSMAEITLGGGNKTTMIW
jgi:hypothetical protein